MAIPRKSATSPSSSSITKPKPSISWKELRPFEGPSLLTRYVDDTTSRVIWEPAVKDPTPGLVKAARVHEWMENCLKIRTKGRVDLGDGKTTRLVPFRLNPIQIRFAEYVAFCWARNLPVKVLEPKPRQVGSTTYWQGLGFTLCVLEPGWHVLTVAHVESSGTEIFHKTHTFLRHLPPEFQYSLDSRQQNSVRWTSGSHSWVGSSSEGDAFGKGPTPSMIHFSEAANYGDKGQDPFAPVISALGSLADNPKQSDTIVVFESTAQGKDPLFWDRCEAARDPNSGSEYTLLFVPWFHDKGYSMEWKEYRRRFQELAKQDPGARFTPTEEEAVLRQQLRGTVVAPHELTWRYAADLIDEQLIWRRWAIANTCSGKTHLFQRYFPATYEEAFAASIRCMFDDDTRAHYYRQARDPVQIGVLDRDGDFRVNPRGWLKIWQHPREGEKYVIAGDVGGGEKKSDPCAAYVVNDATLEVVAALHSRMDWDDFTAALHNLGVYYNFGLLIVETNYNPAPAITLHKDGYPNLYYYSFEGQLKGAPNKPGFDTNRRTRPELISYIDRATRMKQLKCYDREFAREMETFIYVAKEKRYRARKPNHDDRIMSMGLAVYCCSGRQEENPSGNPLSPEFRRSKEMANWTEQQSEQERHEATEIVYL